MLSSSAIRTPAQRRYVYQRRPRSRRGDGRLARPTPAVAAGDALISHALSVREAGSDAAPRATLGSLGTGPTRDITKRATELFIARGSIGNAPQPWMFTPAPTEEHWQAQLAGQTRLTASAAEALQVVADAWAPAGAEIIS